MHDRYLKWAPYGRRGVSTGGIEAQVLKDLANTDNELEKLGILDSYAGYAKRCYRSEMIEVFTELGGHIITSALDTWLGELIPQVGVPNRTFKASENSISR